MQMIVTVKILGTARGDKIVLHGQTCMHAYMRVFTVFHPIPRSGSLKASIYFRVLREEMQARGMSFEQCAIFLRTVNQMEAGVISQEQAERVVKGMIGEHSYIFHSWVRGCTSVRMYMGTRVCAYIWYVGVRAYVRACMCTQAPMPNARIHTHARMHAYTIALVHTCAHACNACMYTRVHACPHALIHAR